MDYTLDDAPAGLAPTIGTVGSPKGAPTGTVGACLVAVLISFLLLRPFQEAGAQPQLYDPDPESIQYIYQNQGAYAGRSVRLPEPVFTRAVDTSANDRPPSFVVQGQGGLGLRVYTTGELPQIYEPYRISGTVQIRDESQTPYVVASSVEGPLGETSFFWFYVSVGALLLLIVAIGTYVFARRGASRQREARPPTTGERSRKALSSRGQTGRSRPESAAVASPSRQHVHAPSSAQSRAHQQGASEGGTPHAETPSSETVRMLGHLEVLSAPDDPDIPLIVPPGDGSSAAGTGYEFTMGRRPAPTDDRFGHIQLKPRTVSREQAKLSFSNGSFYLTNHASEDKNPTAVNGKVLGLNEQTGVSEGDIIKMGEVRLQLHATPRT